MSANFSVEQIQVLQRARRRGFPSEMDSRQGNWEAVLVLIESGHLDGCIILDETGKALKVKGVRLAPSGKDILFQLDEEENHPRSHPPRSRPLQFRSRWSWASAGVLLAAIWWWRK